MQCRVPDCWQIPVDGGEYGGGEYERGGKLVRGVVGICHRGKIGGLQQILGGVCTCRVCCVAKRSKNGSEEM